MLHQDYAQFIESAIYEVVFNHSDVSSSEPKCFLSQESFDQMMRSVDMFRRDLVAVGLPLAPDNCAFTLSDGSWTFVIVASLRSSSEISLSYFAISPDNDGHGRHSWYRRFSGCVLNWNDFCHPIDLSSRIFDSLRKGLIVACERAE